MLQPNLLPNLIFILELTGKHISSDAGILIRDDRASGMQSCMDGR